MNRFRVPWLPPNQTKGFAHTLLSQVAHPRRGLADFAYAGTVTGTIRTPTGGTIK